MAANGVMDGGGPRVRRPSDDPSIAAVSLHRSNPPGSCRRRVLRSRDRGACRRKAGRHADYPAVCAVLFRSTPPRDAVQELLALDPREEA
jgi:hypothetical protein